MGGAMVETPRIFVKPFATEIQNDDGMIIAKTGFVFYVF